MTTEQITIYHNILWSRYKGSVFSCLYALSLAKDIKIDIVQIAESEGNRINLGAVDLSYHKYPFRLLFKGNYDSISKFSLIKKLFMDVWQSDAEFILIAGYHQLEYWFMLLAALLRGKKTGVFCDSTKYDNPETLIKSILKRIFFSQCNAYFCYGVRSREYLISKGATEDKIYFRCQAAALPSNYCIDDILDYRVNLKSNNRHRFLYVGRFSKEKNIQDLLYAFSIIQSSYSNVELVLVGSGALEPSLRSLVQELDLGSVVFTGSMNIEDISNQYLNANYFVLPSSSEPWGLVVNEALSYGCPVIVSHRCGCVPELVIDGVTGYVFECGNIDDLVSKMIQAINNLHDFFTISQNCINLIGKFTPELAGAQILTGCIKELKEFK